MMKYIILFIFSLNAFAITATQYIFISNSKSVTIDFYMKDSALINDLCLKKLKDCKAYKALKNPNKNSLSSKTKLSDREKANDYCKNAGGTIAILLGPKKSKTSFCLFDDLTMVSNWRLYEASIQ